MPEDIDQAYQDMVNHMLRKRARDAFSGSLAFLWSTHHPEQVKVMLRSAIQEVDEVLIND